MKGIKKTVYGQHEKSGGLGSGFRIFKFITLALLLLLNAEVTLAEKITLIHKYATETDEYVIDLLSRSLKHNIHHEYELENYSEKLTKQRLISEVDAKNIQIFWSASNTQLEEQFLPIRIPLYKGLFGHRVFLIRQDQQHKFNKIKSLNGLTEV